MVKEWAHLRWGLGSEHPDASRPGHTPWALSTNFFDDCTPGVCYVTTDGRFVYPNRCTSDVQMENPECSSDDIEAENFDRCTFEAVADQGDRAFASVMTIHENLAIVSQTSLGCNSNLNNDIL